MRGAATILVNCVPADRVLRYVVPLIERDLGVPIGVYANAGPRERGIGWGEPGGPERYADLAEAWVAAGVHLVGGCCGTDPDHIRALRARFA